MPNTKSAGRRVRNSARKQVRNNIIRTQLKTAVKNLRTAVVAKAATAPSGLSAAFSKLDKAVKKGVIKRNTANRRKSRLALALNRAAVAPAATAAKKSKKSKN